MLLRHFLCLKHIVLAVLLLISVICAAEVGLRIYDLQTGEISQGRHDDDGLVIASWQSHHRLRPLTTVTRPHPDTNQPVSITTNSYGLRGRELEVPKPSGVYRILCLGDERVLAPSTEQSATFCEQLQAVLQEQTRFDVEVVNAGVPDYCPLLSYLQLKHSLLALQPDLILLHFDMSDVADDARYRRMTEIDDAATPLACSSHHLAEPSQSIATQLEKQFMLAKWSSSLLEWLPGGPSEGADGIDIHSAQCRYAWLRGNIPEWKLYIQQALLPVDQLNAVADQSFAQFAVAAHPVPWQISATASSGPGVRQSMGIEQGELLDSPRPFQILTGYLKQRGIPFCDASTAFKNAKQPDRLFLQNAAELSVEGHQLYTTQMAAFVRSQVSGIWTSKPYRPESGSPPPRTATRADRLGRYGR